jgi:hypothetical protein
MFIDCAYPRVHPRHGDAMKDNQPTFGPAMMALPNDRQRNFIIALYSEEAPRRGRLNWAVERAGFVNGSNKGRSVTAQRLLHDKRIQKAAEEYSKGLIRALAPDTIQAVRELLGNPKSKHHAKAIAAIMDRVDPIPRGPLVHIENTNTTVNVQTGDAMLERIRFLAAKHGFDADLLISGRVPAALADVREIIDARAAAINPIIDVTEPPP